jgi:D-alanine--poly(phosphoribitol) ligase subunit 1
MIDANKTMDTLPTVPHTTLAQLVYTQSAFAPNHSALVIEDVALSYTALTHMAMQLANWLTQYNIKRLGILASRSVEAYVGIIAAQWAGIAYVPLNPAFPTFRLKKIIEQAQLNALLIDPLRLPLFINHDEWHFLSALPIIAPFQMSHMTHSLFQFITQDNIHNTPPLLPTPIHPDNQDLAYLIFTSGSTGEPKGVSISFGNFSCFITNIQKRYALNADDKISQFSPLTFDVSLFDMVLAWSAGATLYVIPERELLAPAYFIRHHELTVWLAVPSVIRMMHQLKMLNENCFPSLKYSLFTGETLIAEQALLWQRSAPNSQLENLYGPTEATIDCLATVFNEALSQTYPFDVVPIGKPFPGMDAALVNENYEFVTAGNKGELALAGAQVSQGYWQNTALSEEKFITILHPQLGEKKWYCTGDYCYQDTAGDFHYLYRLDNQCKILGKRIELDEIEYYLRYLTQSSEIVVFAIGQREGLASQIMAIMTASTQNAELLKEQLKEYLPAYMIPAQIFSIDAFPYHSNGKLDRNQLREQLMKKMNAKPGKSV